MFFYELIFETGCPIFKKENISGPVIKLNILCHSVLCPKDKKLSLAGLAYLSFEPYRETLMKILHSKKSQFIIVDFQTQFIGNKMKP